MFKKKEELIALMEKMRLDCVCLAPGANQYYLTGAKFHTSERPTVIGLSKNKEVFAVIPQLEKEKFLHLNLNAKAYYWDDKDGYAAAFDQAFGNTGFKRIGAEGQNMRLFECQAITKALPKAELVDAHKQISSMRLKKTKEDVANLKKAIRISEDSLKAVLPLIKIGMSEKKIRTLLLNALFENGAEGLSFAPIVAAGANSANPHASSSEDVCLKRGEPLLIDFGGISNGYRADITRTFFAGACSSEQAAFYECVAQANEIGKAAAKPGATCHDVDDATLSFLEKSKFSDHVLHKTGHGLGLEVHEDPYIMRGNKEVLEPSMVFTVEPGLYIPGKIGVRIEDDVLITEQGCESLTHFDRSLQIISD